eukprot:6526877-Pyramimonas_sp.AAC.1
MAPKPTENQWFWPWRLFAPDGLLRPQDGPRMARESGPRDAHEGPPKRPQSLQERPKRAPR